MGQGAEFKVSDRLYIYTDAFDAQNDLRRQSILFDDRIETLGGSIIQYGKAYYDNAIVPIDKYDPAYAIWYVPSQGGYPANVGWININKNASATVPTLNHSTRAIGETVRITTTADHPDTMHSLYFSVGSINKELISTVKSWHEWTVPQKVANEITKAKSGTVVITCVSKIGAKIIGEKTVNLTVTIPNNATYLPSVNHTITDTSNVPSAWSKWVQNVSKAKVDVLAQGKFGATIVSIVTTTPVGSYSGASITTPVISTSGNYKISTKITDSRGYTRTIETTIVLQAYQKPKIKSFTAFRASPGGVSDPSGDWLKQVAVVEGSSLGGDNNIYIDFLYKRRVDIYFTTSESMLVGNGESTKEKFSSGWDTTSTYDLRVVLRDTFTPSGTVISNFVIGTAGTDYDFNKNGLGIGKFREKGALDADGDIYAKNYHIDTTVYTATLQNGWTGTLKYEENGLGLATIYGLVTVGTANNGTVIATLPEKFKPINHTAFSCYDRTAARLKTSLFIASNGEITVRPLSTETSTTGSGLEFNVTYMMKK